jgi:hypothetical protein
VSGKTPSFSGEDESERRAREGEFFAPLKIFTFFGKIYTNGHSRDSTHHEQAITSYLHDSWNIETMGFTGLA